MKRKTMTAVLAALAAACLSEAAQAAGALDALKAQAKGLGVGLPAAQAVQGEAADKALDMKEPGSKVLKWHRFADTIRVDELEENLSCMEPLRGGNTFPIQGEIRLEASALLKNRLFGNGVGTFLSNLGWGTCKEPMAMIRSLGNADGFIETEVTRKVEEKIAWGVDGCEHFLWEETHFLLGGVRFEGLASFTIEFLPKERCGVK